MPIAVGQLGRGNRAVSHQPPIAPTLVDAQRETVAGLQVVVEIHLARKDVRERHRQVRLFARTRHGRKQRRRIAFESRFHPCTLGDHRVGHDLGAILVWRVAIRRDPQEGAAVDFIFEKADVPVEGSVETIRLTGKDTARVEYALHGRQHALDVGWMTQMSGEQAAQGRSR